MAIFICFCELVNLSTLLFTVEIVQVSDMLEGPDIEVQSTNSHQPTHWQAPLRLPGAWVQRDLRAESQSGATHGDKAWHQVYRMRRRAREQS